MRRRDRVIGYLASTYQGPAPVLVAALAAATLVFVAWPHLRGAQVYHDVTVGVLTWDDQDKSRDYRAVAMFLGFTAILSFPFALIARRVFQNSQSARSGVDGLILISALPAVWRLAVAGVVDGPEPITKGQLAIAIVAIALAVTAFLKSRSINAHRTFDYSRYLPALQGAALGFFATLGLSTAITRVGRILNSPSLYLLFFIACLAGLFAALIAHRVRGSARFLGFLSAPVALLLFTLVPPAIQTRGQPLPATYTATLPLLLGLMVLVSWWQSYRIQQSQPAIASQPVISGVSLVAIAVFVLVPALPIPRLVLPVNFLHFGEEALPWQQSTVFGKLPYVDFIPIQGLMGMARGLLNAVFFDSTAASHPAANSLLLALAVAALFFTVRPLVGSAMATVIAAMGYTFSDRLYFLVPALLLLANPRLLESPKRWLIVWMALCPFMIFYNATSGLSFALGTAAGAAIMTARAYRLQRRAIGEVLLFGACLIAVLLVLNREIIGFLHFVSENQIDNDVANGIAWSQSFGRTGASHSVFADVAFEIGRTAWIWVLLSAAVFAWRDLSVPAQNRNQSLRWIAILSIPTFIITIPWALARIDPGFMSRTGNMSATTILQLLPVLLLLRYRMSQPSSNALVPLAIGVGLLSFHSIHPLTLLDKAASRRVVSDSIAFIDGAAANLPRIGTVELDQSAAEALKFHDAVRTTLPSGETFFNLTYASSFYYFENLPVPTLYAEYLAPASGRAQRRMLHQIAAHPPAAVFVNSFQARDGPAQLRTYYLYREFARRYVPVDINGVKFLLRPDLATPRAETYAADMEAVFRLDDWRKIPSAWGRSWHTLQSRFAIVGRIRELRRTEGSERIIDYAVASVSRAGSTADFAKIDLRVSHKLALGGERLAVRWKSGGKWYGPVRFIATVPTLILPMGSQPRWLLSDDLQELEIRLPGIKSSSIVDVSNVTLLHLHGVY